MDASTAPTDDLQRFASGPPFDQVLKDAVACLAVLVFRRPAAAGRSGRL